MASKGKSKGRGRAVAPVEPVEPEETEREDEDDDGPAGVFVDDEGVRRFRSHPGLVVSDGADGDDDEPAYVTLERKERGKWVKLPGRIDLAGITWSDETCHAMFGGGEYRGRGFFSGRDGYCAHYHYDLPGRSKPLLDEGPEPVTEASVPGGLQGMFLQMQQQMMQQQREDRKEAADREERRETALRQAQIAAEATLKAAQLAADTEKRRLDDAREARQQEHERTLAAIRATSERDLAAAKADLERAKDAAREREMELMRVEVRKMGAAAPSKSLADQLKEAKALAKELGLTSGDGESEADGLIAQGLMGALGQGLETLKEYVGGLREERARAREAAGGGRPTAGVVFPGPDAGIGPGEPPAP